MSELWLVALGFVLGMIGDLLVHYVARPSIDGLGRRVSNRWTKRSEKARAEEIRKRQALRESEKVRLAEWVKIFQYTIGGLMAFFMGCLLLLFFWTYSISGEPRVTLNDLEGGVMLIGGALGVGVGMNSVIYAVAILAPRIVYALFEEDGEERASEKR